ncbi:MAG: hypothetical protein IJC83_00320, partial [Oscillospiraceae bacterium]|nr:hypothetical protein [Oscillospiraceae bacterium]
MGDNIKMPSANAGDILKKVIDDFGFEITEDVKRFKGVMHDYSPNLKPEIFLLAKALEAGIVAKLDEISELSELSLARYSRYLTEPYFIHSYAAKWAVVTWAIVMGKCFNALALLSTEEQYLAEMQKAISKPKEQPQKQKSSSDDKYEFIETPSNDDFSYDIKNAVRTNSIAKTSLKGIVASVSLSDDDYDNDFEILEDIIEPEIPYFEVTFFDKAFEKVIRGYLSKPDEPIMMHDLKDITSLAIVGKDYIFVNDEVYKNEIALNGSRCRVNGNILFERGEISSMRDLKYFASLSKVKIIYNSITKIDRISTSEMIKELDLSANNLSDITDILYYTELNVLKLGSNNITNIDALHFIRPLNKLSLSYNSIKNIEPLKRLTDLTVLKLDNNIINNITPLQNLVNLVKLNLDYNIVSDISPISDNVEITELGLSYNNISDISSLKNMSTLLELNVSSNNIEDIEVVKRFESLVNLDISNNLITDISPLEKLSG